VKEVKTSKLSNLKVRFHRINSDGKNGKAEKHKMQV